MDEEKVIAVSWQDKPFKLSISLMGSKEEIRKKAKEINDCTYKCKKDAFIECIDRVLEDGGSQSFTDKYHGLLISDLIYFNDTHDAEQYVTRKYHYDI